MEGNRDAAATVLSMKREDCCLNLRIEAIEDGAGAGWRTLLASVLGSTCRAFKDHGELQRPLMLDWRSNPAAFGMAFDSLFMRPSRWG
jgi:hypothetical protein